VPVLKYQVYLAIYFGVGKLVSVFNSRQRWGLLLKTRLKRDENGIKICIVAFRPAFSNQYVTSFSHKVSAKASSRLSMPATRRTKNTMLDPRFIRWIKNGQPNQIGTGARHRPERNDASLREPLCFMNPSEAIDLSGKVNTAPVEGDAYLDY